MAAKVKAPSINSASLAKAALAQIRAADAPTLADLRHQGADVTRQGSAQASNASGYYQGASSQLAQALAASQGHDPTTGIEAARANSLGQLGAAFNDAKTAMASDAALRGPGLDGGAGAQLANNYLKNTNRINASNDAASTYAQQTQGDSQAFLANQLANNGLRATQAQGQIGNQTAGALRTISQKRSDLLSTEPGRVTAQENALATNAFNDYATVAGLKLKGDSLDNALKIANLQAGTAANALTEKTANDQSNALLKQSQINATNRSATLAHQSALYKADKAAETAIKVAGGKASKTAKDAAVKAHASLVEANTKVRNYISSGAQNILPALLNSTTSAKDANGKVITTNTFTQDGKAGGPIAWGKVRGALATQFGNDSDVVNAVINLYTNNKAGLGYTLSPAIANALKRRHIGVPKAWLPIGPSGTSGDTNVGTTGTPVSSG